MSNVFEIACRYIAPPIKREAVLEPQLRRRFSGGRGLKGPRVFKSLVARYVKGLTMKKAIYRTSQLVGIESLYLQRRLLKQLSSF